MAQHFGHAFFKKSGTEPHARVELSKEAVRAWLEYPWTIRRVDRMRLKQSGLELLSRFESLLLYAVQKLV